MTAHGTGTLAMIPSEEPAEARSLKTAIWRGLLCRCPNCGEGKLFVGYLKSVDHCAVCGEAMHHHRADDLPPYLTVVIVGHVIITLFLMMDEALSMSMWTHLAILVPLTVVLCLALLRPMKGATIGLQWAIRMHGFGPGDNQDDHMGRHW